MSKHFKSLPPRAIAQERLAELLHVEEHELSPLAQRAQLPFSFSAAFGIWILPDDLPAWHKAAHAYRSCDD